MAVTVEQLAISLRLSPDGLGLSTAETGILSRYLGVGTAHIDLLIPAAPVDIQDECIIRLASYLHDQPLGRRDAYANAWVNSGAGALASKFHPQAASGSSPGPIPAGGGIDGLTAPEVEALIAEHQAMSAAHHAAGDAGASAAAAAAQATADAAQAAAAAAQSDADGAQAAATAAQSDADAAGSTASSAAGAASTAQATADTNRDNLTDHEADANAHHTPPTGGGGGGDPATPTPPVVLVDGEAYTAHGDVTVAGWRGYDFIQLFYANGGTTYQTEPVNTGQLIALSPIQTSIGRNVSMTLTIDATDDDVITLGFSSGNGVPAPSASSTMTIIGW